MTRKSSAKRPVAVLRMVAWLTVAGVAWCVANGVAGPGGNRLGVALAVALAWVLQRTATPHRNKRRNTRRRATR